jgi:hypothetical protein
MCIFLLGAFATTPISPVPQAAPVIREPLEMPDFIPVLSQLITDLTGMYFLISMCT